MTTKMKDRSCMGILFDFLMVLCTGGLWLIWIIFRELKKD